MSTHSVLLISVTSPAMIPALTVTDAGAATRATPIHFNVVSLAGLLVDNT
jgi:hypothetical protein